MAHKCESIERVRWQCRRSRLELDLLLSNFLKSEYAILEEVQRGQFSALLKLPDATLMEWLIAQKSPNDQQFAALVQRIRDCATV